MICFAVLGYFRRDGAPIGSRVANLLKSSAPSSSILLQTSFGLTHVVAPPERPAVAASTPPWVAVRGRLTNQSEVALACGHQPRRLSDGAVMREAYHRWGGDCARKLRGDWAIAAWHPGERRVYVARDAFGMTALYYYLDRDVFAFSTSRVALEQLECGGRALDELSLAYGLVRWELQHGPATIIATIRRLPPAHCLTVDPVRAATAQYWRVEDAPELRLPSRQDYVARLRTTFDQAVRARLDDRATVAATLSGGLDSGAVVVTAAALLASRGQRLTTFTAAPASPPVTAARRVGDEWPLAMATARAAGNVDAHRLSGGLSPVTAIRRMFAIVREPTFVASNCYWALDILDAARRAGHGILLTGQFGNFTLSWHGSAFSQPLRYQLAQAGWRAVTRRQLLGRLPLHWQRALRYQRQRRSAWHRQSAIHPEFARRMRLLERRFDDPAEFVTATARAERCALLQPARSAAGAIYAELSDAFGVVISDPTCDEALLALTLSIPDELFIEPDSGTDRWLMREAMRERLPAAVRLDTRVGLQAADLMARLRDTADEVDDVLNELSRGVAASYVDVPYMREVWQRVHRDRSWETHCLVSNVLMPGILAGLCANEIGA